MLVIKPRQFEALDQTMRRQFHQRALEYLNRHVPEFAKGRGSAEIEQFFERQERVARSFGITTERALVKWFFLAVVTRGRFQDIPECRDFLSRAGCSGEQRMDGLMAALAGAADRKERTGSAGLP